MLEQKILADVAAYLEKYYQAEEAAICAMPMYQAAPRMMPPVAMPKAGKQLDDMLMHLGESFTQMLLRLIDERGMTDPQVYHKANLDRKLFSKIRKNDHYSPNKRTVMALALALELSVTETEELLKTAGFSLSNSSRADLIVRFSLENEIYDVIKVNELLFHYEEPLLGSV